MSPRKRRKRSAAARLRPFWALIVLLVVAAGIAGYYGATWRGFYPKSVVVTGNHVVSSAEILHRAAIAPQQNMWLQSARAEAARVEAIPYVKTAQIHRSLPASIHITVTERTPFAVLQVRGQRAVIDRDLRVLQTGGTTDALPVILGNGGTIPAAGKFVRDRDVAKLLGDYDALSRAHVAVRSLRYDKFGDLIATTRGGIALLLGDDRDLSKKTPLIDPIISQVSAGGKSLAAVDLRAPKTPVVVYKQK